MQDEKLDQKYLNLCYLKEKKNNMPETFKNKQKKSDFGELICNILLLI